MQETNWFHDHTTDEAKIERRHIRVWVWRVLALIAVLVATVYATQSLAAPVFEYADNTARVTLTDEKCKLEAVSNLPFRAVWKDKNGEYEGCWAQHEAAGLVIGYFSDKTVAIFPQHIFKPIVGA